MTEPTHAWQGLLELLRPIHDDAQLFARRIARSNADGDDVFQESLLRAAAKLGSLRDRSRFRPWMHSVIISVHRSRSRRAFWRRLTSMNGSPEPIGDDGSRWADAAASARRASEALATLRSPQREAIVLFELHNYSIEEIAEIQRTSVSSVKSRLSRGRDRLRRFYAELAAVGEESQAFATSEECRG